LSNTEIRSELSKAKLIFYALHEMIITKRSPILFALKFFL
jgi:hypothetical protein